MKRLLEENLDKVIQNIESARLSVSGHHIVKLVAVSKYSDTKAIEMMYKCGQRAFGENQVQQLQNRVSELEALPLEWHFQGSLQKNKINKLIDIKPSLMHSLDSVELAIALNERLSVKNQKMNCLLQINSSNEDSKFGVNIDEAKDIYQEILERCENINLKGVMSIGAMDNNFTQKSFEDTYKIYQELPNATICSMGMSGDYELAIKCGSNLVRIGSALFGDKNG
jgi:pyridoxal phosphate enzyme (YggS family)